MKNSRRSYETTIYRGFGAAYHVEAWAKGTKNYNQTVSPQITLVEARRIAKKVADAGDITYSELQELVSGR